MMVDPQKENDDERTTAKGATSLRPVRNAGLENDVQRAGFFATIGPLRVASFPYVGRPNWTSTIREGWIYNHINDKEQDSIYIYIYTVDHLSHTFLQNTSFHLHDCDVTEVCPNLTAQSTLNITAAT